MADFLEFIGWFNAECIYSDSGQSVLLSLTILLEIRKHAYSLINCVNAFGQIFQLIALVNAEPTYLDRGQMYISLWNYI